MKKRILVPIALVAVVGFFIIFSPFGKSSDAEKTGADIIGDTKQEFFVETRKFGDFSRSAKIKKIGKITGSQDINMSASVSGRVTSISVKAGDNVVAGQRLVTLSDNLTNYGISLDRSENAVSRAQINYDSQTLALDKQILDAEINVDKLESNLIALKQTANKTIAKAQNDVDNINPDKVGSKASLDIEKLDNTIEKLELDYESLLVSDQETLNGLQSNFQNFFNGYTTLVADVAQLGDELFGITDFNRNINDEYDAFLGANDLAQREVSKQGSRDMLKVLSSEPYQVLYNKILNTQMSNQEVLDGVLYLSQGYTEIELLLNNLETTLNNSLRSVGTFGDTEVNAILAEINGYQAQYQNSNGAITSFNTNTKTFLNTYKSNQQSVLKQIELTQKDREILLESLNNSTANAIINFENTVLSQEDQIKNLETQLKNANNQLENARSNKEVSLRSSQNAIIDANINYNEAAKNYNKLIITAPVSGTIGDVSVDIGQEVYSGNSVLTLTSNNEKEIQVGFSKDEVRFLSIGDSVFLESLGEQYTGSILSLSSVADSNLNYKATIGFDASVDLLGDLVSIYILAENPYILFPINMVEVIKPGTGFIKSLSGSTVENIEVQLGDIWEDEIEIVSGVDAGADIIINNISNYDPNKFELKLR